MREKAFVLRFWIFQVLFCTLGKWRKHTEKGCKRPIPGKGGQTPRFVTSQFTAVLFWQHIEFPSLDAHCLRIDENQKGTAGRGREKKCHDNLRQASRAISDLWKRRAELGDIIRRQWIRNLPGDSPARPDSYHGHGEWLHCLPGKWETALLDPVFRLGLNQRLGFPAPGTGGQQILDPYGRHAACCTKGLHTRRHDRIRNLITRLARQAGLTASTEQAMLIPDQIQEDGQPAPGSVRPIHRADVHIIEPQGSELWLDVKIHTVNPDLNVAKELLREEMTKLCRAYGQREGYNLQALDRGMTPVVLEQFGRTAPGAQAIFNRIINHRLQLLVRQGTPFSFAKRTASSELWGPISCTLLRAAWQAHAECAPRIGPADLGDAFHSLPNSPGESQ